MSGTTNTFGRGAGGQAVVVESPIRSPTSAANLWIHLAGTILEDSAPGYSADVNRVTGAIDLTSMLLKDDLLIESAVVIGLAGGFRNETSLFNSDDWLIAIDQTQQGTLVAMYQLAWKSDAWPHRLFVTADVLVHRPALDASMRIAPGMRLITVAVQPLSAPTIPLAAPPRPVPAPPPPPAPPHPRPAPPHLLPEPPHLPAAPPHGIVGPPKPRNQ